jgi:hypothetical protein
MIYPYLRSLNDILGVLSMGRFLQLLPIWQRAAIIYIAAYRWR